MAPALASGICRRDRPRASPNKALPRPPLQRKDELAFRWNNRVANGVNDTERAMKAIKGAEGKRLMYQQTRSSGLAG